jgi:hypothetical protein
MAPMHRVPFAPESLSPQDYLGQLARELDRAPRQGQPVDDPEGTRFVTLSDTLAQEIAHQLREVAKRV